MEITASMVKELRTKTGAGMMDCKKALTETGGDPERAVDFLRERGIAKAAGKSGRETSEGLIVSRIADDRKRAAIVEVSCETDFVARTEDFKRFANDLVQQAAEEGSPTDIEEFLARPFSTAQGMTVSEAIRELIGKLGENMSVRRVARFQVEDGGAISSYIHPGDKLGVVVEFSGVDDSASETFSSFSRDIAMHVAAAAPQAVSRDQLNTGSVEREREIYRQQALNEGKPEKIIDRIVDGKIDKYYGEVTLLEQAFVKDPDTTIGELIQAKASEIGGSLAVSRFERFLLGG